MENPSRAGRDAVFVEGFLVCRELLRDPRTGRRWADPSALPEMSVGALACHLGRQVTRAADLLTMPSTLPVLDSVDEHYRRAPWVTAGSLDDPANDRTADDADAALGHRRLLARVDDDLGTARRALRDGTALDTVPIPWQGWSLRREDFLLTRLLEVVVHTTDLAASLGVAAPDFPAGAFVPVRDLLVRLAVWRHGQSALVDTLSRRERARDISAF